MDSDMWWLLVGFGGQGLFMLRMVIQWLHSEREHRSVIPASFWYVSLAGAVMVLAYSVHQQDPVFIVSQLLGAAIYVRNLVLIRAERTGAGGTTPVGDA